MATTRPPEGITWTQDSVAGVPLRRWIGRAGLVEVGSVEHDAGNRLWIWSSPLAEEAWGWAPGEEAAKRAFEAWLRGWLDNFRPFWEAG